MFGKELSNLLNVDFKTIQTKSYRESAPFAIAIKNLIKNDDYLFEKLLLRIIDLRIRSGVTFEMVNSSDWDRGAVVSNVFKNYAASFSILEEKLDLRFPKLTLSNRKIFFHIVCLLLIAIAIIYLFFQNIQFMAANISHLMYFIPILFFSLYALFIVLFPSLTKASILPDNLTYNDLLRELLTINKSHYMHDDYNKFIKTIDLLVDFELFNGVQKAPPI